MVQGRSPKSSTLLTKIASTLQQEEVPCIRSNEEEGLAFIDFTNPWGVHQTTEVNVS